MRAGTSAPLLFPNTSTRQPSTPQKGVTAALQNTAKNAQTEWDGRKKNTQSIPKTDKINKDTGKDTAEFLGVDSNEILSCTIYHGESKEEIDLTEASGKYLLQMLSDFFNDSKYTYNAYDEVITLQFESLEDLAQSVKRNYYIWIQLGQRISYSLQGEMLEEFNSVIIKVEPGQNFLAFTCNIRSDEHHYVMGSSQYGIVNDFLARYEEWENTKNGDEASEIKMESFIQMLSEHIMETKGGWGYALSIINLKEIDELKDMAEEDEAKYYILLQFTEPVDTVLEFGSKFGKTETTHLNDDLYILEIDVPNGDFLLYYKSGISDNSIPFCPIGCPDTPNSPNKVEDFLQRYEKWMEAK
jgi:hypothetical protein